MAFLKTNATPRRKTPHFPQQTPHAVATPTTATEWIHGPSTVIQGQEWAVVVVVVVDPPYLGEVVSASSIANANVTSTTLTAVDLLADGFTNL